MERPRTLAAEEVSNRRRTAFSAKPMTRGIYAAATGALAQQLVQDTIAANLANVNTTGFRQDMPSFKALTEATMRASQYGAGAHVDKSGLIGTGTSAQQALIDTSAGVITRTGGTWDMALQGDGYFAVMTPAGERYTRAGDFHLQPAGKDSAGKPMGYLADSNGFQVLGTNGPIQITPNGQVSIAPDGKISVNSQMVGQLKIVTAPRTAISKEGNSLLKFQMPAAPSKATVVQGSLEQSNVSAITSMVRMMTIQRTYDASLNAIKVQDDTLDKAINQLPR